MNSLNQRPQRRKFSLPFALFMLGAMAPVYGEEEETAAPSLSGQTIVLEDQNGQMHRIKFPLSKPMFVTVAGRTGAPHVASWITPVAADYLEPLHIVGIASLAGVPDFLKGPLRKGFQKDSAQWHILMDWEGAAAEKFEMEGNGITVFLLEPTGEVVWEASGKPDKEKLDSLGQSIKGLLASETEPTQS